LFTAFLSMDGDDWFIIGEKEIVFDHASTPHVGLALTAHDWNDKSLKIKWPRLLVHVGLQTRPEQPRNPVSRCELIIGEFNEISKKSAFKNMTARFMRAKERVFRCTEKRPC
jgi:hypothetical protein